MNISELKSKFTSISKLKKGGQKTVYKASDFNGQVVALKIIGNATDPRVLQEISILKELALNNIPKIIDSGTVTDEMINEDALFIIEQFINGISYVIGLMKAIKPIYLQRLKFCIRYY